MTPEDGEGAARSAEVRDRLLATVSEVIVTTAARPSDKDEDADAEFHLRLIATARAAVEVSEEVLRSSVEAGRRSQLSWDAVGRCLGISKQAAQQRFGTQVPPPDASGERKVVTGLSSLNELDVLRREGAAGYRLVDAGPTYVVLERSDTAWEHRRALALRATAVRRKLSADGWIHVLDVMPFAYFARRVAKAPVDPGSVDRR